MTNQVRTSVHFRPIPDARDGAEAVASGPNSDRSGAITPREDARRSPGMRARLPLPSGRAGEPGEPDAATAQAGLGGIVLDSYVAPERDVQAIAGAKRPWLPHAPAPYRAV